MKKIFSIIACLFILAVVVRAQKSKETVSIKGKLKNFSNQVEIEDMSDLQYLLPPTSERMIIPDTSGNFSIKFNVKSPNYFRLGRNILYLTGGDDLTVFIDKGDPRTATFAGPGSIVNLYLRNTPFPKGGSFIEAGKNAKRTAQGTIDAILQIAAARAKELDDLKNIPEEFRRLERARIQADLINSLQSGQSSYRPRISRDSLVTYTDEYKALVKPVIEKNSQNFVDASFMKLVVYRDVADMLKQPGKEADMQQISDWNLAYALNSEMSKANDKQKLAAYKEKIIAIKTPEYRDALEKSLETLLKFGKGDVAVDFAAVDMNGNKVALSSLKGKVIYVDLWATWCGPCMAEMPHFDSLKLKYKDNPSVAFVSLSIDDGMDLWKNSVTKRNADGIQWLINRTKLDAYNIVGIPRTLLIDKNFKMVNMNAPVPSSKEISTVINNLLN